MITGDSAAAPAGRIVIFCHCAAASAVIQYSDIHWTAKAATGLALERANGCGVTGRGIGRIIQNHSGWAYANPSPGAFGCGTRRLVGSALIYSSVAGLRIIKTDGAVLDVESGRVVVGERSTISEAARAVHATAEAGVRLSSVAAITAKGRVVCKRGGVNVHASTIRENRATSRASTIAGAMTTEAIFAESVATFPAGG